MVPHTKVATCCYCGTRAALVLTGQTRHELSCAACGAPLHDLKGLKASATRDHPITKHPKPKKRPKGVTPNPVWEFEASKKTKKKRSSKKKNFKKKFFEEAFDIIGDIFD